MCCCRCLRPSCCVLLQVFEALMLCVAACVCGPHVVCCCRCLRPSCCVLLQVFEALMLCVAACV